MSLIFDTSILIAIERADQKILRRLSELAQRYATPPQITFIVYFEFLLGLQRKMPKKRTKAWEFLNKFPVLQTTKKTAEILVELKQASDATGASLSLADLLIASQTMESQSILVTADKDFKKIEGLRYMLLS